MYEISKKYRTSCSINDADMDQIMKYVETCIDQYGYFNWSRDIDPTFTFLDFGCHLGHLSIELAMRYPIKIYAVDNFTGTPGDKLMDDVISQVTNGKNNFFDTLMNNIHEVEHQFKGRIIVLTPEEFFYWSPVVHFAFIDSDHRSSEEFEKIDKLIPYNGYLSGHDYSKSNPDTKGVVDGIEKIKVCYIPIVLGYTFFLRKSTYKSFSNL
jgi:hypothetical protein